VIPGFFDIVRAQNRGVAFGMFNDSTFEWRTTLLVLVSVAPRWWW
jgi:lipoprotein signal peptidase